jgi:hypothetical protein
MSEVEVLKMQKSLKKLAKAFDDVIDILYVKSDPPLLLHATPEIMMYLLSMSTDAWDLCKDYYDAHPDLIDGTVKIDLSPKRAETYFALLAQVMPTKPEILNKKKPGIPKHA